MPSIFKILEIYFFSKYCIYVFELRKIIVTSTYMIIGLHVSVLENLTEQHYICLIELHLMIHNMTHAGCSLTLRSRDLRSPRAANVRSTQT